MAITQVYHRVIVKLLRPTGVNYQLVEKTNKALTGILTQSS